MKRKPIEWEGICASYTSDRGSVSRIHTNLKKEKNQKVNAPFKNLLSTWIQSSLKKKNMAHKYLKYCSLFLVIFEMQIKATLRFNLFLARITMIININSNKPTLNAWRRFGERLPSFTVCSIANWYSHYQNQCGEFPKYLMWDDLLYIYCFYWLMN